MTTVYVGNLDPSATVNDLHRDFDRFGRIRDVWVARKPPGFAFIEFEDERDARDAVKDMDGRFVMDKRIRVEISRRGRGGEPRGGDSGERTGARAPPRRTEFRVRISGLPSGTSWKDLKETLSDVAEPAFVDTFPSGEGVAEFFSISDVDRVIHKLDDTRFRGSYIRIKEDATGGSSRDRDGDRGRDSGRDRDHPYRRDRDAERSRSRERGGTR